MQVGYQVRFEAAVSSETRIKFMTEGMLLRETLSDPLLRQYGIIILDEAHERTVSTDILLGHVRQIMVSVPQGHSFVCLFFCLFVQSFSHSAVHSCFHSCACEFIHYSIS